MIPLLQIENVSYTVQDITILQAISLSVKPGEIVGMIGPNGAGKSTLLRLACGSLKPTQGQVKLGGQALSQINPSARARHMAVIHAQEPLPVFPIAVEHYVLLGRTPHQDWLGTLREKDTQVLEEVFEKCAVSHLKNKPIQALSSGELQKVQIARALAQQPQLLMLDEPTAHLDINAQVTLMHLLKEVAITGPGVVMILHDLNLSSLFCHHLLLLSKGCCIVQGEPQEVLTLPYLCQVYGDSLKVHLDPDTQRPMVTPCYQVV